MAKTKIYSFWSIVLILICFDPANSESSGNKAFKISKEALKDKIKGGWAAQTIGVTFGGPTEFQFNGTFIQEYQPILWYNGYLKDSFVNRPGLYDDIYMDLTFVDILEKEGLDAPAMSFAKAFADADYMLWHANQNARYNILHGIMPPESGHWLNNPGSDDIDFQIEADFAGLMSPGMINAAAEICDRVGHIMNAGDGWYGGVYVAGMYTLAFISGDVNYVVQEALKVIPEESIFYQCISDVIRWYKQYPDDWHRTWLELQTKWSKDVGCPKGAFQAFNIDAKINSAYVVLGLLYGERDFSKTLDIATRAGQDSDCNPATAGGILGTMIGYNKIPAYWMQGLAEVEPLDFKYTTISLNDAYDLSYKHAIKMIEKNGGKITDDEVVIQVQTAKPVRMEQNFIGHYPVAKMVKAGYRRLNLRLTDEWSFEFEGIGFAVSGSAEKAGTEDYVFKAEVFIDGQLVEKTELPTHYRIRKYVPFWKYQLPKSKHKVRFKIVNPTDKAYVQLNNVIIYDNEPANPQLHTLKN